MQILVSGRFLVWIVWLLITFTFSSLTRESSVFTEAFNLCGFKNKPKDPPVFHPTRCVDCLGAETPPSASRSLSFTGGESTSCSSGGVNQLQSSSANQTSSFSSGPSASTAATGEVLHINCGAHSSSSSCSSLNYQHVNNCSSSGKSTTSHNSKSGKFGIHRKFATIKVSSARS